MKPTKTSAAPVKPCPSFQGAIRASGLHTKVRAIYHLFPLLSDCSERLAAHVGMRFPGETRLFVVECVATGVAQYHKAGLASEEKRCVAFLSGLLSPALTLFKHRAVARSGDEAFAWNPSETTWEQFERRYGMSAIMFERCEADITPKSAALMLACRVLPPQLTDRVVDAILPSGCCKSLAD